VSRQEVFANYSSFGSPRTVRPTSKPIRCVSVVKNENCCGLKLADQAVRAEFGEGDSSTIGRSLNTVEFRVMAALDHQLVVRPDFDEFGAIQDRNPIRHSDGRESV
jgi:hypothetical protein